MKNSTVKTYIENNANFAKLYSLTLDVLGWNDFPAGTFSEDGNVWVELAEVWKDKIEDGAYDIFVDAVHRIMWGIPSNQYKPKYKEIIQIVIKELLSDGEAFDAWDDYPVCSLAIEVLSSETEPWADAPDKYRRSVEHYQYLSDKVLWKIRYSKKKYAYLDEPCKHAIQAYEYAIKKIIPEAKSWDEDYWYNEGHIYDAIEELYGVDYSDDYIEYGRILIMLMNEEDDEFTHDCIEAWCASNIKRMPMSLAEVIWPYYTEEKITKMFLFAAESSDFQAKPEHRDKFQAAKVGVMHPVSVFEFSTLRESWLYKLVYTWYGDYHGECQDCNYVKRWLFTTSFRV